MQTDASPLTEPITPALSLDSSDPENSLLQGNLAFWTAPQSRRRSGDVADADLRATALVELPDTRALLGLEAALAFELFHPELTEAGDQGLVPVQDVEAAGFAAGSLNLDLDQLFSFITAGTLGFLG